MRSCFVAIFFLIVTAHSIATAEETVLATFEGDSYGDWKSEGTAFGTRPALGTLDGQQEVSGFRGSGLVNTFVDHDNGIGSLTSAEFEITNRHIAFLIGGGKQPNEVGIELLIAGKQVRQATGNNDEMLSWHSWNVNEFRGKKAMLRIFDRSTAGFGHINVDQIVLTDNPPSGPGVLRLSDYRKTPEYYNERYRPQFHFTPPMNWMNDPNGLVYFESEYHLFYQHNPHGNSWGHMSWGHAVCSDLLHWKHLPIALHEEYGVMVFSGCAVVDHENTSGFADDNRPPMVAVYTGHGLGKQTQDIAYSNNRGRTWTKYAENPVIDLNESDFRDPKVFWHEPTAKWIMVVSMANKKFVQFYGSKDLKEWTHLSDFGPAGVPGKPNWECPDLFELPIEGEPGKTRWVLEVDMGNGSVAGGSGGEYFVGDFDGKEFRCDHDLNKSQWVDYGRDFYAPVSWSDIPKSDGRRIWIGWMNNWETCLLPTRPWRSAMSIPRSLSLRRAKEGFKLVQKPVKELRSLRGAETLLTGFDLDGEKTLSDDGLQGDVFEIEIEFEVKDATEVGIDVRKSVSQATRIGYRKQSEEVFVDRTKSGDSSFHPKFAGRHAAPLKPTDGRIKIHAYVDTSSVEVFAAEGEVVITDRIFPDPSAKEISVYSKGGTATVKSIRFWPLKSIW